MAFLIIFMCVLIAILCTLGIEILDSKPTSPKPRKNNKKNKRQKKTKEASDTVIERQQLRPKIRQIQSTADDIFAQEKGSDLGDALKNNISALNSVLSNWKILSSLPHDKTTVTSIINVHLPQTLENYFTLPRINNTPSREQTKEIARQLEVLTRELEIIFEHITSHAQNNLEINGRFLDDRFGSSDLSL